MDAAIRSRIEPDGRVVGAQAEAFHAHPPALARHRRADGRDPRRRALVRLSAPLRRLLRADRALRLAQSGAAGRLPDLLSSHARLGGAASRLRPPAACGAALPHRGAGEPLRHPAARAGHGLGHDAAARQDVPARRDDARRGDGARLRAPPAAVVPGTRRSIRRCTMSAASGWRSSARCCFMAFYAFRVAEEARQLAEALAATELVLQREQHLSALDGLAAAAAHELGTPLATIALVASELASEIPADDPHAEDVRLIRAQSERCREILSKIASLSSAPEEHLGAHAADARAGGGGGAAPRFRRRHQGGVPKATASSRWRRAIPASPTGSATWSRTPSISPARRCGSGRPGRHPR